MAKQIRFVAMLFPEVTQLDLTGPVQAFARVPGASIDLAAATLDPVQTDAGFAIVPTTTYAAAPDADVVMVPGGLGAFHAATDPVALDFVRRQALVATYVTSVCTGAFVLGAAGLLTGRRATTHWASHPMLELLGAIPVHDRVVRDGRVITAGGITSGIDFALTLIAELLDDEAARRVQLIMEYDPQPPFDAGSPTRPEADPDQVAKGIEEARASREPLVRRAAANLRSGVA